MIAEICQNQSTWWAVLLFYASDKCLETWLGKTTKVRAGSVLELIFNAFRGKTKENGMLEGKEFEVKQALGEYGQASASLDLDDKGIVSLEVAASAKVDLIAELEKHALKTGTKLDDSVVAYLKQFLGRA